MHQRHESGDSRPDRRVTKTTRALKAALAELILEKGYDAVTVQNVIDRAEVSRSTFYAHFIDKDDLVLAIFRDLEEAPPDPATWARDDPPFAWTRQLFRHLASGRRLFRAVAGSPSGHLTRHETDRWLGDLARAELRRLGVHKRNDPRSLEIAARFVVWTFLGFMNWWTEEANADVDAETVDAMFRSLALPGVAELVGLERSGWAGPAIADPTPPRSVTGR